jgi:hypothetical protein
MALLTVCALGCAFSALQPALDSAKPGDIIELKAGEVFSTNGPSFLRAKPPAPYPWITIRSSAWRSIPPGRRVSKADAEKLPKICTSATNNQGVLWTSGKTAEVPAAYWRFKAVWFTICNPSQANASDLVVVGDTNAEIRPDLQSHHFTFDQVLITGWNDDDYDPGPKRGLVTNGHHIEVLNSSISNIKGTVIDGSESHALGAWVGSDILISNTRLSSATENFLFGGARAKWAGFVATNIRVEHSLIEKDLDWNYINWPHPPTADTLPTCTGPRVETIEVGGKMYLCDGLKVWQQVAGTPSCLSDETGGLHWRDTSAFPSNTYTCVAGKWTGPHPDRMHPVLRTATDVLEGPTTKIISTAGISNIDWNNGTWVVISGISGPCAAINQPWQIQATGGNSITIHFDSSACGPIEPSQVHMQFQFSNWDTKNGGEFKNVLGAHVRGNIFRNCIFPTWQNQKCRAFLLNLTGEQDGPASTLSELTFSDNLFLHSSGGIEQGSILCSTNNTFVPAKIIRGNPTQLLDSGCSFLPGDNILLAGAPATGPWAILNGSHSVIALGSPGFGGDAFIDIDSSSFPPPDFTLTAEMDIASFGPNRTPRDIIIENNIFQMGHPNTITGGWIGGSAQFSASQTPTTWYSYDLSHMAYGVFDTSYIHNTIIKPEYGLGYNIPSSLIPGPLYTDNTTVPAQKIRLVNRDNIWEGNYIQGYRSETPCSKAIETYVRLPMIALGNLALSTLGGIPSGMDKNGCEGFTWETARSALGYTSYPSNLRLLPGSKHKGKASDGTDPGVDQDRLDAEIAGVLSGVLP